MKTLTVLALAAAAMAAPAAALATSPAVQAQPTADSKAQPAGTSVAESDDSKKICRKLKRSGTRVTEKVCLTKDQWTKVDREALG